MVNLFREYKKYKRAKAHHLTFEQCLSRKFCSLNDKIYTKLIFYFVGNDQSVAEAAHSARIYKKLSKQYRNFLVNRNNTDDKWTRQTFPKMIWWCWLQGEKQIPELPKICLHSLQKNLPDYKIQIITLANLKKYINLPDVILNKYKAGWISGAHFSDFIRLSLLAKYGGIWIDSTVYCTNERLVRRIEQKNMFVYQSILSSNSNVIKMSNWLIATKKNNPYIVDAAKLLINYYKKRNYTEDYFVCHLILTMLSKKYPDIWDSMDIYNNVNPHMMQYVLNKEFSSEMFKRILERSSFHKLNRHLKFRKGNTFYNHLKSEDSLCEEK